jgi:hypothetical protein
LLGKKKIHTENTQIFQVYLPNKISKNKKILPAMKITASDLWHLYVSDKDQGICRSTFKVLGCG